jgi:CheY-like chemotaxis protein
VEPGFAAEVERRARAAYALATRLATAAPGRRDELLWELRRDTHTLRGSALVLGLDDVVSFAADLEQLAHAGELDLPALGARLERVLEGLSGAEPAAPAPPAAGGDEARTILCVDDSEPNLLLLERFLARHGGAGFVPARTGEEALELAAAARPDLILLDLQLPVLSGLEVLERLRADPATAGIPVVVVSADARDEEVAAAQEHGARDYLVKPVDLARLGAIVDAVLGEVPA